MPHAALRAIAPRPVASDPVEKVRLDTLLAQRGLFPSRARAAASVMAGEVRFADGARAAKPGQLVAGDVAVALDERPRYVSRGGIKLANALDALGIDVGGLRALDVGASTGGFTDCLLQRGAAHVVALDVAYGELDWSLRTDDRVTVLERCNARAITRDALPYEPDLVVCDVSFISLTKALPAVFACLGGRFDVLAMVKPQFEVGRGRVGKGGVVRDPQARQDAILEVARSLTQATGAVVAGIAPSGLPGPKGNLETFLRFSEPGRPDAIDDLERAVAQAGV